ncbi:Protein kinase domain-containing protein [Balamuthia mandrillaris]
MQGVPKNIIDNGLPPLGSRGASSSSAHYDKGRQAAFIIEERELGLVIAEPPLVRAPSRLWFDSDENPNALAWGSEKDIQRNVVTALKDVLTAAGIGAFVSVQEDLTMFSINSRQQKSDVYLVKQKTVPIGIVEVKKPTENIFDKNEVNGQIYDYMMALRSFSGLRYVFGILTTYEQWRVCWLPDANQLAQAEELPPPVERRFQLWSFLPPTPQWVADSNLPDQNKDKVQHRDERQFYATPLYSCTHPSLPLILTSAVRKMERSPMQPAPSIHYLMEGTGLLAKRDMFCWAEKSLIDIVFGVELTDEDNVFWLLADLHGGADGNVLLASTPQGKGCVVKFSRRNGEEALLACRREAAIWTNVWGRKAFALKLGQNDAVVMPYVNPCAGSGDPFDPPPHLRAATRAAIAQLSQHRIKHDDLKWSHVGRYLDTAGEEKVVLFDLAQVSGDIETEEAKRSMEEALGLGEE